jgi:uncharacterized membrane protein YidH (DUF202 family)
VTSYDADGRDPGLAAERTDLAWSRSGLSLLAFGALILRGIGRPPLSSPNIAIGLSVFALGACTWFVGAWHVNRTHRRQGRATTFADLAPVAFGVATIGFAAFCIAATTG